MSIKRERSEFTPNIDAELDEIEKALRIIGDRIISRGDYCDPQHTSPMCMKTISNIEWAAASLWYLHESLAVYGETEDQETTRLNDTPGKDAPNE